MHGLARNTVGYHAMRLRWCGLAVQRWLRRWGVYALVTMAVVGAGTNAPVAVVAGLAGALVTPLCLAAAYGPWLLPATALQALAGAGCVWGARALLWPAHWAESERALPLARSVTLRSDAGLVAAVLVPLALLYALGMVSLLAARPAWLWPVRGRALAAVVLAVLGSLALGVLLLQRLRRAPRPGRGPTNLSHPASSATPATPATQAAPLGTHGHAPHGIAHPLRPARLPAARRWPWLMPLVLQPLWRGPARRSGQVLALGGLVLLLPVGAALRWPAAAAWALALQSAAGLVVTTRANTLLRLELAPLLDACAPLPLQRPRVERARAVLSLLPWALSSVALALALPTLLVRLPVLAAWLAFCAASAALEVCTQPAEPADKAARWLFCLAVCVALATEVLR